MLGMKGNGVKSIPKLLNMAEKMMEKRRYCLLGGKKINGYKPFIDLQSHVLGK